MNDNNTNSNEPNENLYENTENVKSEITEPTQSVIPIENIENSETAKTTENTNDSLITEITETEIPTDESIASEEPKKKKKASKKVLISGIAIVIVIALISTIVGINIYNKKIVEEYKDNIETISYAIIYSAANAENIGNLTKKVWRNAIYEDHSSETDAYTCYSLGSRYYFYDFNTALANLYSDDDFASDVSDLETEEKAITLRMKDMTNPPEECEEAYSELKEYYNSYLKLVNLVVSPSGSYNDFSDAFNSADTECVNCYNQMKLYFE